MKAARSAPDRRVLKLVRCRSSRSRSFPPALILTGAHALLRWRSDQPYAASLAAFLCLAAAHAIFWIFTFPANQASANWTVVPPEFERMRAQWEWSHAAGALHDLTALVALLASVLRVRERIY